MKRCGELILMLNLSIKLVCVWQATEETVAPESGAGGMANDLGAPTSAGYLEQNKAAIENSAAGRENKDKLDGGSDADQTTGFSGNFGPSGIIAGMEACLESSIVVVVEEVEMEPSSAERLPSSTRLFVTVSSFLPFLMNPPNETRAHVFKEILSF